MIAAAGGNGVFKQAPSYLQLLVRREVQEEQDRKEEEGKAKDILNNEQLKIALDRKPKATIIKIGKIEEKDIPKEWSDYLEQFG